MHDHEPGTIERARKLRREMSLPEVLLWQRLRSKPLGVKFRNQHPVGKFVADLYCHQAKQVIEIDGIVHDLGDNPERDEVRNHWMHDLGLKVLRIPAVDVLADPDAIAQSLAELCRPQPARNA